MINISFVSMTQGNVIALKRTLDSLKNICNEFIIGSICVFEEDEKIIESYRSEYNLKVIKYPFDYIFKNGFASILNDLSTYATDDLCLYLNVGEVPDGKEAALRLINEKFPNYNCYAINHGTEKHTWYRLWNKNQVEWRGILHEELYPREDLKIIRCPYYIFQFKDTDKDSDPLKAAVYNSVKELVYFRNYMRLIEEPEIQKWTNEYWIKFAEEQYNSMKERLLKKGKQYEAFKLGDINMFLKEISDSDYFKNERFDSSILIEFQNSYKSL